MITKPKFAFYKTIVPSMEVGLSGQNGHLVRPLVGKVCKEGQEHVTIQLLNMADLPVKEKIMKLTTVFFDSIVQLMETGLNGRNGRLVRRPVRRASKRGKEHVTTRLLSMAVLIVKVKAM